jgi:hypothetical protein
LAAFVVTPHDALAIRGTGKGELTVSYIDGIKKGTYYASLLSEPGTQTEALLY